MFRLIRRMRRDERGQALVIGAIAMLVLAVTVMASVSIGHGVYSKIKLQDAADAQSYSIAVKQARAYNFLAYTNRAMVVHYNAMLTVMSYVSHAIYLDTTIGNAAKFLKAIPYIGAIFAVVEQVIKAWKQIVETVAQILIPVLTFINIGLWVAQEALLLATMLDLFTTTESPPIAQTDKKAKAGFVMSFGSLGGTLGAISNLSANYTNVKNFLHPIDDGPHSSEAINPADPTGMIKRSKLLRDNKLSDPDMAKYRLLMADIANSARRKWTAIGTGPLLIGRRWNINICLGIGGISINKTAESLIKNFDERFERNRKDQLLAADDISIRVKAICWKPTIFKFNFNIRVAADYRDGFHMIAFAKTKPHNHNWMGITPFVHSDPSFYRPWSYHFSYPCNIVFLTKDMMTEKQVFEMKAKFLEGEGSFQDNGVLDMTWTKVGGDDQMAQIFRERTRGMMAMSVGRAIYHRPGVWKEEPNFFNPLWTARLAPVSTHWEKNLFEYLVPEWGVLEATFGKQAFNY